MPGTVGSIETSTISCTDCLSTFSMSRRERNVRVQEVQLDASWLHQSPLHRPSSSKKQLQLSSSIVINVKARAGARLRRSVDPMQQFVCLPYQLMRSAVGVIVVLAQLQNHCRSRETCSFGTPDAVVCRAARSASAATTTNNIGRAGRGRRECRHRRKGGRCNFGGNDGLRRRNRFGCTVEASQEFSATR